MTVSDNEKKYDCMTCPYPRYREGNVIFCDVCIRRIIDDPKIRQNIFDFFSIIEFDAAVDSVTNVVAVKSQT